MLHAIEVIIEPSGLIRLLEDLHVNEPTKAVLTLFETPQPAEENPERGNGSTILALLAANPTETDFRVAGHLQEAPSM